MDRHSASRDVVGQHPDAFGAAERRVREVPDPQVGAGVGEHAGYERERVVLHEHDVTVGRRADDRVGERLVHRHVGVPRVAERGTERGRARQVEDPVEQEPEHLVRHDLVVQPML